MYNDGMRRAFKSLQHHCPAGFGVELVDNDDFITVRIKSDALLKLDHDSKRRAVEYVYRVKNALEDQGAIVLVVRTPIDNPPNLSA